MPFTFRKSFRILPGVRLNLNKRSTSITVGPRWLKRTWSTNGTTTTSSDLPGPVDWRSRRRARRPNR